MKSLLSKFRVWLLTTAAHDEGQATTEYALVLLGAALIALLVIGWATTHGAGAHAGGQQAA